MALKLDSKLRIGVITIHRRTEPATGPWQPSIAEMRELVELVDRSGYESLWCGDHISFPAAILDPLLQLAQAAVVSRRLHRSARRSTSCRCAIRCRWPSRWRPSTTSARGASSSASAWAASSPGSTRPAACRSTSAGPRLTEAIRFCASCGAASRQATRGAITAPSTTCRCSRPPRQPGGPPIWCGGRSDGALARAGRLADGWIAYVVTPEMFKTGLDKIAQAASEAGRGRGQIRHRAPALHAPRRHL